MASSTDRITDTRNAARPNSARVTSGRAAAGSTLVCDNLAGWPTASKVHFVTYQIDSSSNPVAGTQLDCYGIVSGNDIGSFTVVDGTDTGNSVGDVVEMLPTAAWGQDLADALTAEHSRTGTHTAVTATSLVATGNIQANTAFVGDTISERTGAAGVTIDGLQIKDGNIKQFQVDQVTTLYNPYKFSAYRNAAWTTTTGDIVVFDTELFDTNSNFSTSTGKYTAPVNGFYVFSGGASYINQGGSILITGLAVNGTSETVRFQETDSAATGNTQQSGSTLLQLSATDTVALFVRGASSGTGGTGRNITWFCGYLVSKT